MRWLSGDGPKWEEAVAGLALAVVFLSVVWGVIARYIAPQPAVWSNELATIGFAWLVFLGAASMSGSILSRRGFQRRCSAGLPQA